MTDFGFVVFLFGGCFGLLLLIVLFVLLFGGFDIHGLCL